MSETIALADTPQHASAIALHPADILMTVIVAFLAPMFLTSSGGDIQFARMAAIETVNAYRARNHADLIAIAQVIACGLTALGSLALSLADNLSLSMTLRLRSNAVALNRAAELNRRALRETPIGDRVPQAGETTDPTFATQIDQPDYHAEVIASVAAAQGMAAEAFANLAKDPAPAAISQAPTPEAALSLAAPSLAAPSVATPSVATPGTAATTIAVPSAATPKMADRQRQDVIWASAIADVAGEFAADIGHLSPNDQIKQSRMAALLSRCASDLISGNVPSQRTPPGLAAIIHPRTA
ncbi:MAG TPA: hypothetical protein VHU42_10990 [Rhodopila sp.]|nr:hypothetical protein [Rhodopila sp.]